MEKNNEPLVRCLKQEGIRCNFKEVKQQLTHAIERNDLIKFTQLIELANIDDINLQLTTTRLGSSLLLYALMFGNSDMAKLLIDRGADLLVKDWVGTTALSCAIASNNSDCFHVVPIPNKEGLFIENIYGLSPIHYAVRTSVRDNDSKILDELCQRFDLEKKQIMQDYQNYPQQRVDQEALVEKLSQYIQLQNSKNKSFIDEPLEDSKDDISQKIKHGLCHGLSFLFGLHGTKTPQDLADFFHTIGLITSWDGTEESLTVPIQATYMQSSFHTLGELINQFSNDALYFYAQNGLSTVDIAPHDRATQYKFLSSGPREIKSVLDISMQQMRKEEFVGILRSTLKPNTLLDLTGAAHTISIVCNSEGDIYYYDPNNVFPTVKPITDLEQLATLIYNTMPVAYNFQNSAPHYIGVYNISDKKNDDVKNQYPSQEDIVNKYLFNTDRKNDLYKELQLCVLQDSGMQFECLLKSDKLSLTSQQIIDIVDTALVKRSFQCLNKLIKFGNLEQCQLEDLEKKTSLSNYREILDTLDKQSLQPSYQATFFR